MYISCEYFDNSLKALRGIADPGKRKIIALFQLSEGQVCHNVVIAVSLAMYALS